MTDTKTTLAEVQGAIAFLKSAEAALMADGPEASRLQAATVGIEGASAALNRIAKTKAD